MIKKIFDCDVDDDRQMINKEYIPDRNEFFRRKAILLGMGVEILGPDPFDGYDGWKKK